MPLNVRRLRNWFLAATLVVIAVVAVFYLRGRLRVEQAVRDVPKKQLGLDVSQSTSGFSLSKSEGGRTLFTIRAAKATQYRQRGRAELEKVDILVYGKQGNRYDQIYGDKFTYDPETGDIAAEGQVHIDLEANTQGPASPDQAQPEALKNPIHFRTSDLVFNQKTGFAATNKSVEFRIPQASGSAVGATYDAHQNVLTLQSAVVLHTAGKQPSTITAQHAVVTKEPRQAVLHIVRLSEPGRSLEADRLTIDFRPDNSVERILAGGDVRGAQEGQNALNFHAGSAEILMNEKAAQSALLSGGVTVNGAGNSLMNGSARRVEIAFGPRSKVEKISAIGEARFGERPKPGSGSASAPVQLAADALDFMVDAQGRVDRAVTRGAASITTEQGGQPAVITAGQFTATFDAQQRLKSLHGAPDARVVSRQSGQPDRVTSSQAIDAAFTTRGGLATLTQAGDFRYTEGDRSATAERARYTAADQVLALTGSPRVTDGPFITSATSLRFDRRTNDAFAEGNVKSTYSNFKSSPGGALLASSDPIHVTARSMTARRTTGVAVYRGGARLWQGANIVEAPTIEFDRNRRSLLASGVGPADVKSVFVQQDASGKTTPVSVTAARLTYSDADRRARFQGGVVLRGADGTISADRVDVILRARTQAAQGPSELDRVVAQGNIVIQQGARRATGRQLTYYSEGQKFVLTGGPPVIVDPQQGSTTGDSLTFYSGDDRVVVGSGPNARTVTQTKVSR